MTKTCFVCCNQCFESNADVQHKFYVTNCYHVFCAGCLTNNRSICNVCNKRCKILPIDENLPKEVKIYFEPNSHRQLLSTTVKVHEFQQTQVKNYVERHYSSRKKYYQLKQQMLQLVNYRKQALENAKREKAIMEKLKEAYRTNVISPDLFQMRSQAASPQGLKTPQDIENTPRNTMVTSTPNSLSSSTSMIFQKKGDQGSHTQELRHNLTLSNLNRDSQMRGTQRRSSGQKDVINDARKGLIASALRDMNQLTQTKKQVKDSQRQMTRFMI
ncbi:zip homologous protein 3-like [Chironomus tepperi]|uniref:zip homologous protein 3-like n=1 Tax=Chironomus tepperi TaxID=113505 RepID=UPI00391F6EC6